MSRASLYHLQPDKPGHHTKDIAVDVTDIQNRNGNGNDNDPWADEHPARNAKKISRKRDNRTDFARLGGTLTLQRPDVQ